MKKTILKLLSGVIMLSTLGAGTSAMALERNTANVEEEISAEESFQPLEIHWFEDDSELKKEGAIDVDYNDEEAVKCTENVEEEAPIEESVQPLEIHWFEDDSELKKEGAIDVDYNDEEAVKCTENVEEEAPIEESVQPSKFHWLEDILDLRKEGPIDVDYNDEDCAFEVDTPWFNGVPGAPIIILAKDQDESWEEDSEVVIDSLSISEV